MTQSRVPEQPGSGDINIGNVSGTGIAIGHGAQAIVTIYQTVLRPLPVNLSSLIRPLIEHYAVDLFGGRDAELAGLDAFLADSQQPFGLLVAPTGLGKTALLVHWIARVQQEHPQWRIIFAPVSIRYQTASEQVTLSILAHSLAEIHNNLEQFRGYDQSPSSLRALITDYLCRTLPAGTQLLLVLDGVDEATGWEVGPLCAIPLQAGLKIVVAARQRANATRDDYQQLLGWTNAPVAQLDLQALDLPAVAALLRQSDPTLAADPAFVTQFYRVSEGDPLTSNLLINALNSGKITPDSLTQRPPGLEAFLKDWVEALRRRRQASRPIRELLALCAAAYGPLRSDDLQALAPDVFLEQTDIVDAVHDDEVTRFIITVGKHTYVFSHQRLREVFLDQIYPPKDRERLQQRLIAYGNAWYADRTQPLPDYLRQFWVTHLAQSEEWATLRRVLTEIVLVGEHYMQPWAVARYHAEGSYAGYLADLCVLWQWADVQHDTALGVRCALIQASILSLSDNLTPALLVSMVTVGTTEGQWSAAAALEHIRLMKSSSKQVECIKALSEAGCELPWVLALEVARGIADKQDSSLALAVLAPHLPLKELPDIYSEALTVAFDAGCDKALNLLLPHLSPNLLAEALIKTRDITNDERRSQVLAQLVPFLPQEEQLSTWVEALTAMFAIKYEPSRIKVLRDLVPHLPPHLPPHLLAEVLTRARAIAYDQHRAEVLTRIAPLLPQEEQPGVWKEVFMAIQAIKYEPDRAETMAQLAPYFPSDLVGEALAMARLIWSEKDRVEALCNLMPYLPLIDREKVQIEALSLGRALDWSDRRARILCSLAFYLPPTEQAMVLAEAFAPPRKANADPEEMINSEPDAFYYDSDEIVYTDNEADDEVPYVSYASILTILVPHLPSNLLLEASRIARGFRNARSRGSALVALAPHLPSTEKAEVLEEALEAVRSMSNTKDRVTILEKLIPLMPSNKQSILVKEGLAVASFIGDTRWRDESLAALADYIPLEDQEEIIAAALSYYDTRYEGERVETLRALIPHLPSRLLEHALNFARDIRKDEEWQILALADLAPYLPTHLLIEALHILRNSRYYERYRALTAYAPYVTSEILAEVLPSGAQTDAAWLRDLISTGFAAHLPPHLLKEALDSAGSDEGYWAAILEGLAPHLSHSERTSLVVVARALENVAARAKALVTLLSPHMSPTEQAVVLDEALQAARAIRDDRMRANALTAIMPHLREIEQAVVLDEALQAACAINGNNRWMRVETLIALASYVPASEREKVLDEALRSARTGSDMEYQAYHISTILPYLPQDWQAGVLIHAISDIRKMRHKDKRAQALRALTPYISTVTSQEQYQLWSSMMLELSKEGRPALLKDLPALLPWLKVLAAPNELTSIALSISDVSRCWP